MFPVRLSNKTVTQPLFTLEVFYYDNFKQEIQRPLFYIIIQMKL